MQRLQDNRIMVTGATGGIGRRVVARLTGAGCQVIAVGRDGTRLAALQPPSGRVEVEQADFADGRGCEELGSRVRGRGGIDGLVLIYPSVPKSDEIIPPANEWRAALDLCFVNPLAVLRGGLLAMRPGGRAVVVSGVASVQVFPALAFSNAIRAAWLAEVKLLSHRLGPQQIRVNTLSLGGTMTEAFASRHAAREGAGPFDDVPSNIPLGRYGSPDGAAESVVALLSHLSDHMTGANLVLDGGLTRAY